MKSGLDIDSKWINAIPPWWRGGATALVLLLALTLAGCSSEDASSAKKGPNAPEKPVLMTSQGNTSIRVTETVVNGQQIVRIHTVIGGEETSMEINIDQPTYEIEVPIGPQRAGGPGFGGPGGGAPGAPGSSGALGQVDLQRLQVSEALDKARDAMVRGDYLAAMRNVDIVLRLNSNHIEARAMKGSVYYALGDFQLANNEWNRVLLLDPGNKEVQSFQDFLNRNPGGTPPPLPGAPPGAMGGQAAPGGAEDKPTKGQ